MMDETVMRQVAWIGDRFVTGEIRGVILVFHGLGSTGLKGGLGYEEQEWAASGGLVVFPYYGPWSWMNRPSRKNIDELVSSIYQHFKLSKDIPLIVTGGSMGGQGALIYTRYSPHRIAACFANYPVCDLEYHFTERPDLPPTMRYAYRDQAGDFQNALIEHSPLKQAGSMPDIPYLLIHGDQDLAVNKEKHSDRFVAEMRKHGRNVEYLQVPGMGHASNVPFEASRKQIDFVKRFLLPQPKVSR